MSNERIIPCEACQTEGRMLTNDGGPDDVDHGPCPYCEGTGGEIIETQPVELDDLHCLDCDQSLPFLYPCFQQGCPVMPMSNEKDGAAAGTISGQETSADAIDKAIREGFGSRGLTASWEVVRSIRAAIQRLNVIPADSKICTVHQMEDCPACMQDEIERLKDWVELTVKTLNAVRIMMKNRDREPHEEAIYAAVRHCIDECPPLSSKDGNG